MNETCYSNQTSQNGNGSNGQRLYGKFRGKVLDNVDPLFLGRIIADVPAVPGSLLNWALPCTPYAGLQVGFYAIPPIGANVWVEFEGGDPNYPIWSGCFWGEGEVPLEAPPEMKIFKTEFITMILNDTPEAGGFTLECIDPAVDVPLSMLFNSEGITISCPEATITMTPETITLTVPESSIIMDAENITITVPESVIEVTAEDISLVVPASSIDVTGEAIEIEAPDLNITAPTEIEPELNVAGAITAEGDVNIAGALTCEGEANFLGALTAEGDVNALGALTVEGGANILGGLAIEGGGIVDGIPII